MRAEPNDFHSDGDRVTLPDGWYVEFKSEYDQDSGAPWEECEGHGPVTNWVCRDKHPGERVLISDRSSKRYYDFAEAMKIAKRDNWGVRDPNPGMTKGQILEAAVEADFQYLKDWCDDKWHYIGVIVTLYDEDGNEQDCRSCWRIEDSGDYYQEIASDLANELIALHEFDVSENANFACRC